MIIKNFLEVAKRKGFIVGLAKTGVDGFYSDGINVVSVHKNIFGFGVDILSNHKRNLRTGCGKFLEREFTDFEGMDRKGLLKSWLYADEEPHTPLSEFLKWYDGIFEIL